VTERALVIGIGNTLRSDDGVGQYAAQRLAGDPRLAGATVIAVHQLAPELVIDMAAADLLVVVDAGRGPTAGTFTVDQLRRSDEPGEPWSHLFGPAGLVALAEDLYGNAPATYVVTVGVASVEAGNGLSPAVEAALPLVVDAIANLVAGRPAGPAAANPSHA
jgi:hydrogenase maturation protease